MMITLCGLMIFIYFMVEHFISKKEVYNKDHEYEKSMEGEIEALKYLNGQLKNALDDRESELRALQEKFRTLQWEPKK